MNSGFLSKKKFHPGKLSNQIKIWKAEQKEREEKEYNESIQQQKLDEIQKEKEAKQECKKRGEEYIQTVHWIYEEPSGFLHQNSSQPENLNEKHDETQKVQIQKDESKLLYQNEKERKKILNNDPMAQFKSRREHQIDSLLNDPSQLRKIQEKHIRKLIDQWYINKENHHKRLEIEKKLWNISEHGKIGEYLIKEHNELWKWWKKMIHSKQILYK